MDAERQVVIAGVGAAWRPDGDPPTDPVALMVDAVVAAVPERLRRAIDQIVVPQGSWSIPDPGRAVAAAVGAPTARTVLAELGVLQTALVGRAVADVVAGRSRVSVVVGGEARRSAAERTASAPEGAGSSVPAAAVGERSGPDEVWRPDELVISRLEIDARLVQAVEHYALVETAYRAAAGLSPEQRRADVDALWRAYADAAMANPWAHERRGASLLDEQGWGRPMATPYRLRHTSQWNVDQAAAVVVCSVAAARDAGVDPATCVYPVAIVGSDRVVAVTERDDLAASPGLEAVGEALVRRGVPPAEIPFVELYSCFPVAVSLQLDAFGLASLPPSLTGGMTFGGGPFDNAALMAVERVVAAVRESGGSGLVTALSGMVTKQGALVVTGEAPDGPPVLEDLTAEVEARSPRRPSVAPATLAGEPAKVVAATVCHDRNGPTRAAAVLEVAATRTLASSTDPATMDAVAADGAVGERASVLADGSFRLL